MTTAMSSNNIVSLLETTAGRVADRPALVVEPLPGRSRQVTFAELWDRIDRTSVGLRSQGLRPGERTIIMIPMSIELYVVLLAVLKLGAVAVFVDPWIGMRQIAAFSAFAGPTGFLGIPKSHLIRLVDSRLRRIRLSMTTGRRWLHLPARCTLSELMHASGDGRVHAVKHDDPALITFTSGSSGVPKGANRTHRFLLVQHDALKHEFPYRDDDIDMPMFPVFALNNLAIGITSIVPTIDFRHVAATDGGLILDQMRRHGVTTCTASPPFIDRVVDAVAISAPPPLRRILTGGAPVTDDQLRTWHRALPDTETLVVYGSTEAEPVAHIGAPARLDAALKSHGRARGYCVGEPTNRLMTRVVRIEFGPIDIAADGWGAWQLADGEIGELIVAGDHVCRDYYENSEAVRENKIVDDTGQIWHRMGDTGYFDDSGRFWLVGRLHSTIARGNTFVHPQLVEQAALEADDSEVPAVDHRIRRVAAVGMPDVELGERVVVVIESDADPSLGDDVRRRLAAAGQPCDAIEILDRPLPVDPRHNSKIDYAALKRTL